MVGTVTGVVLIENDEVWGVARIADKTAIKEMRAGALSTSPSVVFRDPSVNLRLEDEDGSTMLVEGPASLLDHVAICKNGVWDKDNGPTGVVAEEVAMADDLMTKSTSGSPTVLTACKRGWIHSRSFNAFRA